MQENPFTTFISLVTFDASLRTLQKQKQSIEKQCIDLEEKNNLLVEKIYEQKQLLTARIRAVDVQERELKELEEQLASKQQKLPMVSTPKEYFSLQQEIARLEQSKQHADEEMLAAWSTLSEEQRLFAEQERLIAESIVAQKKSLEQLQMQLQNLEDTINQKQHERAAKEQIVPAAWLEKYQAMLKRVENPVVPVENSSCSGCFYPISQQDMAGLMRHKLLECKGCYRMLYIL